jgi:hypothetical protein
MAQCRAAVRRSGRFSRLFTGRRVEKVIEIGNRLGEKKPRGFGRWRAYLPTPSLLAGLGKNRVGAPIQSAQRRDHQKLPEYI